MAPLALGHALVHLARRPVVGSAIIEPATMAANRDAIAFFAAIRPRRAHRIATRREVGWVLRIRLPPARYLRYLRYLRALRRAGPPVTRARALATFRRALATRLAIDRGSRAYEGSLLLEAIPWLQHRWEGAPLSGMSRADIFRVVRGARIAGRARPGARVVLQIALRSNRGRPFGYSDQCQADGEGRFSLKVPYDTEPRRGQTAAIAPARLSAAGRTAEILIPRAAVDRGLLIQVDLR